VGGSDDPRQKLSVLGQKRDGDIALRAESEQGRAARNLAEADDPAQSVNRHAQTRFAILLDDHGLGLTGQVRALGGDVQRIEEVSHQSFSSFIAADSALFRYLATDRPSPAVVGRQISSKEQRSHFGAYRAWGVARAA
jgi:hypothetical protein